MAKTKTPIRIGFLIGVFYIPYVYVKGSLKMSSLGVTKVNITKSRAMRQSRKTEEKYPQ